MTVTQQELYNAMRQLLEIGWAARDFIDDKSVAHHGKEQSNGQDRA